MRATLFTRAAAGQYRKQELVLGPKVAAGPGYSNIQQRPGLIGY